jgi:hypothetical protein
MIIDTLPPFIQLVKQNIVLHALVVAGSWHDIDLSKWNHITMGKTLIIKEFRLSDNDIFEVHFSVQQPLSGKKNDKMMALSLITHDSKYFDNAGFYFSFHEDKKRPGALVKRGGIESKKDIGVFRIYDDAISPAFVLIRNNPFYGFCIYIRFYSNFDEVYKRKKENDDALESSKDSLPD